MSDNNFLENSLLRVGETTKNANVSFDELLNLLETAQEKTSRSGAVIGNAFKSIFTRLSRKSVIEELNSLGVNVNYEDDMIHKLTSIKSFLLSNCDHSKISKVKELSGGVFQINLILTI